MDNRHREGRRGEEKVNRYILKRIKMRYYNRSKEDFRELLIRKYNQMEEKRGCLGTGESPEDYVLCNGDSDLLPKLVKKDEIRYEYNQYKYSWSYVSCTIF